MTTLDVIRKRLDQHVLITSLSEFSAHNYREWGKLLNFNRSLLIAVEVMKRQGFQVGVLRWSVFVLLTGLTGCRMVSTVQQVQENPQRNWFTATVYLQGTVGDRAPLLEAQLYELQDSTGKIWVLSRAKPLPSGKQVLIKGQVRYQAIEIGGQNFGDVYIEEEEQLEPES
jgi:hypothetical protein